MGIQTRVIVEDFVDHPRCKHGPMLRFCQTDSNSNSKKIEKINKSHFFYACAAYRDRKKCTVYHNVTKNSLSKSDQETNTIQEMRNQFQQKRFHEILRLPANQRGYCYDCSKLLFFDEFHAHGKHHVRIGIDDLLISRPTTLLNPISNDKREAQYFFTDSSLYCICDLFNQNRLNKIICIGAPRLHEHLRFHYDQLKIKSILLDFDQRYKQFYSSDEFCLYNMFNHYFFDGPNAEQTFEQFLKVNEANESVCLFTDPPFGCRTEALTYIIKLISRKYQEINKFKNILSIMWIFPYFMETYIREEMPEMEMIDYKINYTNHKLYHDGDKARKQGSPIRIFTNIPLSSIALPTSEGYRFCEKCQKWSSVENVHCDRCKCCPSKNGSTYIHCNLCAKCVKSNYRHCFECDRCTQIVGHNCKEYQQNLTCWICQMKGHNEKNCTIWFKHKPKNLQTIINKTKKVNRKICWICQAIGHNEKNCIKRKKLLKETLFLDCSFACDECGVSFQLSTMLIRHKLKLHRKRQKISILLSEIGDETIYSSDSDCDYQITTTIRRIPRIKKEPKIDVNNFDRIGVLAEPSSTKDEKIDSKNECDQRISNDELSKEYFQEYKPFNEINKKNDKKKIKCNECSDAFREKYQLFKHMRLKHRTSLKQIAELIEPNENEEFRCSFCNEMISTRMNIQRHLKRMHRDELALPKSKKTSLKCKSFHEINDNGNDDKLLNIDLCYICGKRYKSQHHMKIHMRKHTGERPFKCDVCGQDFAIKKTWQDHSNMHSGIKPYKCNVEGCNKSFAHSSGVRQHKICMHSPRKRYQCDCCQKLFSKKHHLLEHIRTHTGERPHACEICGIKFRLSSTLRIHYRTHTGERPFRCKLCNKGFIKSYGLTQHMRTRRNCIPVKIETVGTCIEIN